MFAAAPRVSGTVLLKRRKNGDQFYAKYRVNGRQLKKRIGPAWTERGRPPLGYYTRKSAQVALQALLTDIRRGAIEEPIPRGKTFGEAADDWLHYVEFDKARAHTTVADYTRTVKNHFLPEFGGDTPLPAITTDHVEAFRDRLLEEGAMTRASIQSDAGDHARGLHGAAGGVARFAYLALVQRRKGRRVGLGRVPDILGSLAELRRPGLPELEVLDEITVEVEGLGARLADEGAFGLAAL